MAYDNLGTAWRFEIHTGRLGTVYGVSVEGANFRIAPDDRPHQDKWRIDYNGMGVGPWEAVVPTRYDSAEEAADALVRLDRAHKLEEYKPKKEKHMRGSLLAQVTRLAHEVPETREHLLPLIRKFAAAPYASLADAAMATHNPKYLPGKAEIWYTKPSTFGDFIMGPTFMKERGRPLPTAHTISKTHILLGTVDEINPERIWVMMQGEHWSPQGQARGFLQSLRLQHTSMSVGDAVKIGTKLHMVDRTGFVEL